MANDRFCDNMATSEAIDIATFFFVIAAAELWGIILESLRVGSRLRTVGGRNYGTI